MEKRFLAELRQLTGKPHVSYVQVEKVYRKTAIPASQFEAEMRQALAEENAGVLVFEYGQLVASPQKVRILQKLLKEYRAQKAI